MEHGGIGAAFAATGAAALAAAWIATGVPRRQLARIATPFGMLSQAALLPALVGGAVGVAGGAFLTFAPLHALELGLSNPGIYLTAYAVGMIAGQLGLGAVASRIGRGYALIPALLVGAAVTMMLGRANSVNLALGLSFMFGFTNSGVSPVLTTWAIERAHESERARAASTSIASRELGGFVGAAALGAMLSPWGSVWSWLVIGGIVALGAAAVAARTSHSTVERWRIASS
jgi:predicted MFS family arabinose efflux permease